MINALILTGERALGRTFGFNHKYNTLISKDCLKFDVVRLWIDIGHGLAMVIEQVDY